MFQRVLILLCVLTAGGLFVSRLVEIPERSALRGWDNSFYLMWVRSAVIDHDINFANEVEINNTVADDYREQLEGTPLTPTGYYPNKYGIGWGLLSLPFFIAADLLVVLLRLFGWDSLQRDGYNFVYQTALQFGHLGYALAGLYFAWRFCRFFFDRSTALSALLATWGCSMLIYYQAANLSMAHNLVFSLTAAVYFFSMKLWTSKQEDQASTLAFLFATSGLLIVTRFQTVVYLVFPAVAVLRYVNNHRTRALHGIVATLPIGLIPVVLQILAWKVIYGSYLVFTYGRNDEGFVWSDPAWTEVLFSPFHGLFYWHPALLVSALFLLVWIIQRKRLGLLWLVSIGLTWIVNAAWWCWWMATSFGYRSFEAVVLFLICGTAYLLTLAHPHPRIRTLVQTTILLAFTWNINLVILYSFSMISRRSEVTWGEMLTATINFYPSLIGL